MDEMRTAKTSTLKRCVPWVGLASVAVLVWVFRARMHFDWGALREQLRHVSWATAAVGVVSIYVCYWLRAWRWAVLMARVRRVSGTSLLPAQMIGFTMVGLFGRVVDLARPWLIARKTETAPATQLAVYSVERAFDLGAAAVLFSLALAFAPRTMPHHELFVKAGVVSLGATLFLAGFAVALRMAGTTVARLVGRGLKAFSGELAEAAERKVLEFREGLNTVGSTKEFFLAAGISLVMWAGIALAYMMSARAFKDCPELAGFGVASTLMLMAAGMGASLFQLPVVGWFSQIAGLAVAMHAIFGVPVEAATASAAVNVFATTLAVIPAGLVVARVQGVGLRQVAVSSKQ